MITKQHEKIINDLIRITADGNLEWFITGTLNQFYTKVGEYRINIYKIVEDGAYQLSFSDTICAEMSFIDKSGLTFDHITIKSATDPEYQMISELHDLARRSATRADKKLEDIISILQKD